MELFQLGYFAAAARHKNFSRAAQEVCVAQPSLSLQIAQLESEVGAKLFLRLGRGVELTDAGIVLLEYAERMLQLERDARQAVRNLIGLEAGSLSLWTLPTIGQHLLPDALARFRRDYPQITLRVHEAVPARRVAEAVASGSADLGFLHLPCPIAHLHQKQLLTEELALVVPMDSPLSDDAPPRLADLADADWVWVPDGDSPEHPFYAACLAAGFAPRIACVSGSSQGMQAMVASGLGIALLPRLALHPPKDARIVELAVPRPTRTLAAIWRHDEASLSHAARSFLGYVVRE